jgi:hypothetical protein
MVGATVFKIGSRVSGKNTVTAFIGLPVLCVWLASLMAISRINGDGPSSLSVAGSPRNGVCVS